MKYLSKLETYDVKNNTKTIPKMSHPEITAKEIEKKSELIADGCFPSQNAVKASINLENMSKINTANYLMKNDLGGYCFMSQKHIDKYPNVCNYIGGIEQVEIPKHSCFVRKKHVKKKFLEGKNDFRRNNPTTGCL